jgi:hypothetical protein
MKIQHLIFSMVAMKCLIGLQNINFEFEYRSNECDKLRENIIVSA